MRGGKRAGAGKKKGTKNRRTIGKETAIAKAVEVLGPGLEPLAYMLEVMRDASNSVTTRLEAAKSAAPYMHQKKPLDVVTTHSFPMPVPVMLVYNAPSNLPNDKRPSAV